MAGSNFDAEIKKGMQGQSVASAKKPAASQPASAKSSTNAAPSQGRPPASSNKQNEWNQSSGPVSKAGTSSVNGDHSAHISAIHQHLAAIHSHIAAISSGSGAGGGGDVNSGTVA